MKKDFKAGDHVEWNSEAGIVRGTIEKKITAVVTFKGYTVRASKEVAAVSDQKRHNRPFGDAQGIGAQEAHKQNPERAEIEETAGCVEKACQRKNLRRW